MEKEAEEEVEAEEEEEKEEAGGQSELTFVFFFRSFIKSVRVSAGRSADLRPSPCRSVGLSLSVSLSVCRPVSFRRPASLSAHLFPSLRLSVGQSPSVSPSVCRPVSVRIFACLSARLRRAVSVSPSVRVSAHLRLLPVSLRLRLCAPASLCICVTADL